MLYDFCQMYSELHIHIPYVLFSHHNIIGIGTLWMTLKPATFDHDDAE